MREICIDQRKEPGRIELDLRRHQASETPNEPAWRSWGDSEKRRPDSKCNCCFETHGSRSGMITVSPQTETGKASAEKVCGSAKKIGRFGRTNRRIEQTRSREVNVEDAKDGVVSMGIFLGMWLAGLQVLP